MIDQVRCMGRCICKIKDARHSNKEKAEMLRNKLQHR
jgi:hypothetical protein